MLDDFWRTTPRNVWAVIRAYHRRRGWMAWHVAVLGRVKDMPRLDDLMGIEPEEVDEAAEAERQLAVLRQWQAADRIMAKQQGNA